MTTLPDLEPCPFCGETRIFLNPPSPTFTRGSINCPACLACMPGEVSESELIECWNRRAARSAPEAGKAVVKPLVWEKYPAEGHMVEGQNYQREYIGRAMLPWNAAVFLMRDATGYSLKGLIDTQLSFPDEEAAKAAAQADYEQRILSALASPTRQVNSPASARRTLPEDTHHG